MCPAAWGMETKYSFLIDIFELIFLRSIASRIFYVKIVAMCILIIQFSKNVQHKSHRIYFKTTALPIFLPNDLVIFNSYILSGLSSIKSMRIKIMSLICPN